MRLLPYESTFFAAFDAAFDAAFATTDETTLASAIEPTV